ncbi:MAG TPA: hypothetical protein VGN25_08170 [Solirubrobacteraceae bacterium]|jgi:colicin import membrane protein|nr:hypothetical protein [Solirubrobacteraceae bacterium]
MPENPTPSAPHSDPQQLDPKALARSRREAVLLRTRKIRRSVTGLALGLFTAAFLAVYVQLASGHDPALSANAERRNVSMSLVASTSSTTAPTAARKAAAERAAAAKKAAAEKATAEKAAAEEAAAESSGPSAVTTSQS